jgi:hypothetical protein
MGAPAERIAVEAPSCDKSGSHPNPEEADKLLASVYTGFNEGLETADLKTAAYCSTNFAFTPKSHTQLRLATFSGCLKRRSGSRFTKIPEA